MLSLCAANCSWTEPGVRPLALIDSGWCGRIVRQERCAGCSSAQGKAVRHASYDPQWTECGGDGVITTAAQLLSAPPAPEILTPHSRNNLLIRFSFIVIFVKAYFGPAKEKAIS